MDKQKAKILFDLLRSSNSEKVVRGLREIKKRLLTNIENLVIFRSFGLVPQALKLVQRPNEDILNGALSILSGCCTNEAARNEVYNVGGAIHLLNVLKCAKSESLQLRACRTMANQAQHRPSCDIFFKLNAVELVIEMLTKCKEDETKVTAIRGLRILANNGEHCQKIVTSKGILHICSVGFGTTANSPSSDLLRSTVKAIAHFSRISHPACVSQIMEGTDNMMLVSKLCENSDLEIYECVLRTILNVVQTCFESTTHKRDALDAKVIDRLCTARAPTIIVSELQNRRVNSIEEEKLILALCKFCEGSSECNNLTIGSFSEPPTFLGRAWMQLIECGGITLLVSLLITHRHHAKVRPAILKAILGVEHNYSYKDTILKHFLAAKLLPQLAEQFDELMTEYKAVRRDFQPGCCIHTLKTEALQNQVKKVEKIDGDQCDKTEGDEEKENKTVVEKEIVLNSSTTILSSALSSTSVPKVYPNSPDSEADLTSNSASRSSTIAPYSACDSSRRDGTSAPVTTPKLKLQTEFIQHKSISCHSSERECGQIPVDTLLPISFDSSSYNPQSPGVLNYHNPKSPGSVSCSPRSNLSNSESSHFSSTWPLPQTSGDSSPVLSFAGTSFSQSNPLNMTPWPLDSALSSPPTSPYASPPHSPMIHSPPRCTSPIKVPSDWEYDDEEEMEHSDEDGRFSPVVHDTKDNDFEDKIEIDGPEESDLSNDDISQDGCTGPSVVNAQEPLMNNLYMNESEELSKHIDEKLVGSPTAGKRLRDSSAICVSVEIPQGKKIKCDINTLSSNKPQENNENSLTSNELKVNNCQSSSGAESLDKEVEKGTDTVKSPFIRLNQIKFRVRKKGHIRRQISPTAEETMTDVHKAVKVLEESQEQQCVQQATSPVRRDSNICSTSVYSDLNSEETQSLKLLELVVRVISQVAHVKEAINPVCREFVPRIVTYLSTVQVIHKSATRMLVTIARNPLCIQPLLDSLFIPYVGVELGEAGDPESPNGCSQCRILSEGAVAFLDQMVNFFNHVHQYGQCEVSNRLNPARNYNYREGCVMALPHITRCPKLLHDFMLGYSALDLLMNVLHSEKPPNEASYMYATAAISRLAKTLQLDNRFKPVKCAVCLRQGKHTPEEVADHFKMQLNNDKMLNDKLTNLLVLGNSLGSEKSESKKCKWKDDEVKDVTFKLEDGSTVSANREFLSEKNEVLRGMLMGSFVEGESSFVKLALKSKSSLEMLIHFLYGCRCDFMESKNVTEYIDLVFLSQMYLVEDLHSYAMLKLLDSISDGEDIIRIYESGVGHIDENLILQVLCIALVRPMKTWKRARWLKELFQSSHSEDIDHNIRMIIHHPLDMNRLVCCCDQSQCLYKVSESEYTKLC